jgi:hypothetical protein
VVIGASKSSDRNQPTADTKLRQEISHDKHPTELKTQDFTVIAERHRSCQFASLKMLFSAEMF